MEVKKQDHREIAKNLDLYALDEKAGQVITPVLGNKELYQISGHLFHYQDYMFPEISRNNESYYLRPMTCPHHCLIYQQKILSYREMPLRLCENSLLFRYEASGALKGLERIRWFELADHHVFVNIESLKEELKRNYYFIQDILNNLDFAIERLVCSLHDSQNKEKYHPDKELWQKSENLLITALEEMKEETKLEYLIQKGEAAFYGPKLDLEVKAADGKHITIATIQLDFLLPQKFNLRYIDKEQKLQTPIIIHQSPIGSYQRFISLLLEKTSGKLPIWLAPVQLVILPLNDQKEVKEYSENLQKKLLSNNFRSEIWQEKTLNYRVKQVYEKKIPYRLVIGEEELKNKKLKLVYTYSPKKVNELTEDELLAKLKAENNVAKIET
ncbi:453_t:CDS:2 [Entrophospora sp. SA101]|nr:453_t:CDS:2 [Entrophospora sp. SA101]